MNTITHVNPADLHQNPAFSQGTIAEAGRTLYVGGQNGTAPDGSLVTGGVAEQSAQALRNVLAVLAEAGAAQEHVAKMTVYLAVDAELNEAFGAVATVWGRHPTAITVLRVNPAREGALIEIDAVALLP